MSKYHTPKIPPEWALDRIRECLAYDPSVRSVIWAKPKAHHIKPGARAGRVDTHGYLQILFSDKENGQYNVFAHHVVWFIHTGKWPPAQLDHRDLDPQNNDYDNLRLADCSKQTMNQGIRSDNSSGEKNIRFNKDCGQRPWEVAVRAKGRKPYNGYFATLLEARAARDEVRADYHGEFARGQ